MQGSRRDVAGGRWRRRALLKTATAVGMGLAASRQRFAPRPGLAQARPLSVLCPVPPDPAPPGVAQFSIDAFTAWQLDHNASVHYDAVVWSDLHDRIAAEFAAGALAHDVLYMSGWVPEFARFLEPIGERLTADLRADLPTSSRSIGTWNGNEYGVPFTCSLLTLFYNTEHLEMAGIATPPATWEELKTATRELTRDGRYGWVLNYGAAAGIGGVASYWMAFLQQAGGRTWGEDGLPVFNDASGVDALQCMIDLMPHTHPVSIYTVGITEATRLFSSGGASMMMNWPFMRAEALDPIMSQIVDKLGLATLPAGPAGTASIDASDVWTIAASSPNPDLALELIEFYLDPEIQKRQALDTGWLPARLSTLADPEVQQLAPHAAVVVEQARHPYDSFVTPDYVEVTNALGREIQKALIGEQPAAQALRIASEAVTAIVRLRAPGPAGRTRRYV